MQELSVQQLIDCSWGYQNNGCRGGWSWRALQFVKDHGLATRSSYGKYIGQVRNLFALSSCKIFVQRPGQNTAVNTDTLQIL